MVWYLNRKFHQLPSQVPQMLQNQLLWSVLITVYLEHHCCSPGIDNDVLSSLISISSWILSVYWYWSMHAFTSFSLSSSVLLPALLFIVSDLYSSSLMLLCPFELMSFGCRVSGPIWKHPWISFNSTPWIRITHPRPHVVKWFRIGWNLYIHSIIFYDHSSMPAICTHKGNFIVVLFKTVLIQLISTFAH